MSVRSESGTLPTIERSPLRRRHQPFVGRWVTIEWTGNDAHRNERIVGGYVVNAGPRTLWIDAPDDGVKVRQNVFIKYEQIRVIADLGDDYAGVR